MVEVKDIGYEIENHRQMAIKAMGMFLSASTLSTASVAAQGARISEQCKIQGLDPLDLRMALLVSDDLIELITNKANKLHVMNVDAPDVTDEDVRQIVKFDFIMAEQLMVLDIEKLQEIYNAHSDFGDLADISYREIVLKTQVSKLLGE